VDFCAAAPAAERALLPRLNAAPQQGLRPSLPVGELRREWKRRRACYASRASQLLAWGRRAALEDDGRAAFVSLFDEGALDQRAKTLGQPRALARASTRESA
jgi:hypothetical protein